MRAAEWAAAVARARPDLAAAAARAKSVAVAFVGVHLGVDGSGLMGVPCCLSVREPVPDGGDALERLGARLARRDAPVRPAAAAFVESIVGWCAGADDRLTIAVHLVGCPPSLLRPLNHCDDGAWLGTTVQKHMLLTRAMHYSHVRAPAIE